MEIAVIGAGGVGGYFGARLAAAGHGVHIVARGAHGAAIRDGGLRIESPRGDLAVRPATVVGRPEELPAVDLVMNCVKLWDLEASGRAQAASAAAGALTIPFQNGVESAAILAGVLGEETVAQGVAYISAEIAEPGRILHKGDFASLAFGPRRESQKETLASFSDACKEAGFEGRLSERIEVDLWRKFMMLSAVAGATAMMRGTMGEVRANAAGLALLRGLVEEAAAVGRAEGVALPDDAEAATWAHIEKMADPIRASMAVDLERGNRLELPWLSGTVQRLSRKHGLETPASDRVVAELTPFAEGRRVV